MAPVDQHCDFHEEEPPASCLAGGSINARLRAYRISAINLVMVARLSTDLRGPRFLAAMLLNLRSIFDLAVAAHVNILFISNAIDNSLV